MNRLTDTKLHKSCTLRQLVHICSLLIIMSACTQPVSDNPGNIPPVLFPNQHFVTEIKDENILKAMACAELILKNVDFVQEISAIKSFTGTKETGYQVTAKMLSSKKVATIKYYTSSWFYRMVLAYAQNDTIYLNTRRLNRSIVSLSATLVHEFSHNVGYTHTSANDLTSVPYKFSEIAIKYGGCK